MRLKGINIFEQHLEKFVAGLFALALLGVLAWQFLAGPTNVKIGQADANIADAYSKIASTAQSTDTLMHNSPSLPAEPDVKRITGGVENFQNEIIKPVAPKDQLVAAIDMPPVFPWKGQGNIAGPADAPFAEIVIPAPTHAMASPNMSTVATFEAAVPEVAKILPAAQPYDKASVTVEAIVEGNEIRKILELDPDGAGPMRPLPKNWWENGTHILAIVLHRQMLKPDGTWTASEKVPGMPGRAVQVDKLDTLNDAESLKNAVKLSTDQPDMVLRTPFYLTSIGDAWVAPSEREALQAQELGRDSEIKTLQSQHADSQRKIKLWEKQLSELGRGSTPPSGRPGGGGGGGRPGGGGAPPTGAPPSQGADDAARKRLQGNIDREKTKDAKTVARLGELGVKIELEPGSQQQTSVEPPKPTKGEPALLDNPSIRIWAHDVFVQRGATYRYQISIALTNPYFGHSAAMVPAQAEKLAKSGVIRSAPSEWTEPVTVDRETYVFFPGAVEDEPVGGTNARAHAEFYQFKWGYWRRGADDLEPGDRVAAQIKIPDYSKVMAAQPANPNNPAPAPTDGGGRGGRGFVPPTGGAPTPPGGTPAPLAADIPKVLIDVATKEMILGVGHSPTKSSSSGKSTEVFIREENGNVRVATPDQEKADSVYVRISKSAERGEKDANPPQEKPKVPAPGRPNPDDSAPSGRPGGRGGG